MSDWYVEKCSESISMLLDGKAYKRDAVGGGVRGERLIAGSRAEGLAIEERWGHPGSDEDNMILYGGHLGVHVPQGRQPPGRAALLRYKPDGCPVAYCKVQVTDAQAFVGVKVYSDQLDAGCIHRSKGVDWLHVHNLLKRIKGGVQSISGPAGQSRDGFSEYVPTLVCSDAHPDMDREYMHRPRHGWPSPQQLKVIKQFPLLLVLTGHKLSSEFPLQTRFSWSHSEMELIITLPLKIKQVYVALKYAFKRLMKNFRKTDITVDGRSQMGSFHLKMTFLNHLERRPPTMIGTQLDLMLGLLSDLNGYLKNGKLPHYFLPDCNLLTTVGLEERRIACEVIQHIVSDPLRAILTCPTAPWEIYGEVQPDVLVAAFHQVSSHPTCVSSCGHLLQLLGHLDETRLGRYRRQLEWDMRDGRSVSCRAGPAGLVDMLRQHIQTYVADIWNHKIYRIHILTYSWEVNIFSWFPHFFHSLLTKILLHYVN